MAATISSDIPFAAPPLGPYGATPDLWDKIARLSLLTAIFLSSWGVLRVGSINLTFADAAFLVCLFITAIRGRLGATPFGSLSAFWLTGLVMMLGGLFVGSVVNGDPLRWINIALQYSVAFLLIPMVLMQQDERTLRKGPLLFVLGATLSQIIGIAASFFLTLADTNPWLGDGFITGNGRLGSMAGQPNPNGAVIAFALPMLFYCLRQRLIRPVAGFVCLVLLLWGLMLTASFTGFSASMIAMFLCLLIMRPRYAVGLGLLAATVAGLLFVSSAPLPKAFQQRVGTALETGDIAQAGTFVDRAQLMAEAWGFAEEYSVVGMGVDRYREISAHDNPVHNLYLLIWNEGSAIALAGLVLLFSLMGLMAALGLRYSRDRGAMAIAVMLVFLIYTMSYPHMYSRMWMMPIMLVLAVIHAPRPKSAEADDHLIYPHPAGPPLPPTL